MKNNLRYVNRLPSITAIILAALLTQLYACKNKNGNADSSMKNMDHENMKMEEDDSNMGNMDIGDGSMQGMDMSGSDSSMKNMKMNDGMGNMPSKEDESKIAQHALGVNTKNLKVNDLLQPSNRTVIAAIGTISPVTKTINDPVIANGTIDYDQRRFSNVASRFNGRIERLYVKYNLQKVSKGQKLFDIYSPELLNAQQDYIFLLSDTSEKTLIASAEKNLLLLGLTNEQVAGIRTTKKTVYSITIFSPASGYVVREEGQQKNISSAQQRGSSAMSGVGGGSATPMGTGMSNMGSSQFLKEGQYVSKGETVFRIVNTDVMWALVKVFREDLSRINLGNKVEIIPENSETPAEGKVDFIQPYFKSDDKTALLRVYLSNTNGQVRSGNLFKAKIYSSAVSATWIPRQAVVDIGNSKVVFLKVGSVFRTARIKTGATIGNLIAVLDGLSGDSEIASNAQYLIDSEAFIKIE